MDRPVRVRFAPSPTGAMHIGGVRTALFNWLFARHYGGAFILRIEDTDQKRYVEGSVEIIYEGLRWLGLTWDEGPDVGGAYGPYVQSERLPVYQQWAQWLIDQGKAYRCYATPEELEEMRQAGTGYDRRYRDLGPEDWADKAAQDEPYVIRFKMPLDGQTTVQDLVRGDITFENTQLQDLVLLKSDGFPTYHLANVVDDHLMEISHIMRGEEWISSAPTHWQLYAAFGWEMPQIAHLPVILNPNGKGKLSKRSAGFEQDGRQVPVLLHEFREMGYLPEAVANFLTNIGWSFGDDREQFTMAEAIERFDLSRVNPAAGIFPLDKLDWLNGVYIRDMDMPRLTQLLVKPLEKAGYQVDVNKLAKITPLIQPRIKTFDDVLAMAGFFFKEKIEPQPEALVQKKLGPADTVRALMAVYEQIGTLSPFEARTLETALRGLAETLDLKTRELFWLLRVAVTGQEVAPPLFETLEILGRDESLARIKAAEAVLQV